MTNWQRLKDLAIVFLQIGIVILLFFDDDKGLDLVLLVVQVFLMISAFRYLLYYFTMARYMVDGKSILYKGGIYLDLGVLVGVMNSLPSTYLMLYEIGYFALSGIYRCMTLYDTRKMEDKRWIQVLLAAGWYLILALRGICNLTSESMMIYLFSVEMSQRAVMRLIRIFRRTAIVYIQ